MALAFVKETANVVLIGPNGVGKSTLALNLASQAIIRGRTPLFSTAGQTLGELAALDSDSPLRRRLNRYASPDVLVIDEVD
jgi:DNA replication protein DnaC